MPVPPAQPVIARRQSTAKITTRILSLRFLPLGSVMMVPNSAIPENCSHKPYASEPRERTAAEVRAAVEMVITELAELPAGVTEVGDILQVALVGSDPQLNLTAAEKTPPIELTVTWYVVLEPLFTVALVGVPDKLKSTPVPVREAVCGLTPASSLIVMTPLRLPDTVGLKDTLIRQFTPAARVAPQLFVCE